MGGVTATVLGFVIDDARQELAEILANPGAAAELLIGDPWSLTDAEVVDMVDAWHPGGWAAFLRESAV